jgi:hypothetical protein
MGECETVMVPLPLAWAKAAHRALVLGIPLVEYRHEVREALHAALDLPGWRARPTQADESIENRSHFEDAMDQLHPGGGGS